MPVKCVKYTQVHPPSSSVTSPLARFNISGRRALKFSEQRPGRHSYRASRRTFSSVSEIQLSPEVAKKRRLIHSTKEAKFRSYCFVVLDASVVQIGIHLLKFLLFFSVCVVSKRKLSTTKQKREQMALQVLIKRDWMVTVMSRVFCLLSLSYS